ncbi:hypothetical protein BDW74DRAFT_181139 [Aspergillus multicolor]|uniref:uncharacterized protein n=1 Tax=Aspergillus multicolor TaxID=41759 RepID=UPI003CCDA4A4
MTPVVRRRRRKCRASATPATAEGQVPPVTSPCRLPGEFHIACDLASPKCNWCYHHNVECTFTRNQEPSGIGYINDHLAFMPVCMLTWSNTNVASTIAPFELSSGFYHWGYALPPHETYAVLGHIYPTSAVRLVLRLTISLTGFML